MRDVFRARAQILESSLEAINYELDWAFPPREHQGKIRLGVLAFDFAARTETFVTLPVFRELDRSRFEVNLFALRGDYPRHKAWARWTFPVWYYVSVTGVLVYFFLYRWWPATK